MMNAIKKFLKEEDGLTAVEYAACGALITVAVITAFTNLGTQISTTIDAIRSAITPAA